MTIYSHCEVFELIKKYDLAFWLGAVVMSLFWGFHGVSYAIKEDKKKKWDKGDCHDRIILLGYFVSEFIGSFIGWICLYVLSIHMTDIPRSIGMVDVFLVLGVFVGISGWAYRIFELINIRKDKNGDSE